MRKLKIVAILGTIFAVGSAGFCSWETVGTIRDPYAVRARSCAAKACSRTRPQPTYLDSSGQYKDLLATASLLYALQVGCNLFLVWVFWMPLRNLWPGACCFDVLASPREAPALQAPSS